MLVAALLGRGGCVEKLESDRLLHLVRREGRCKIRRRNVGEEEQNPTRS